MAGKYAKQTDVPVTRSREEIETIVIRYGADQFAYAWENKIAIVGFRMNGRQLRYRLPLPDRQDKAFTETDSGKWIRDEKKAQELYEQAIRQRWRALGLVIKAKLEAIEVGIAEFDNEFLGAIVLPNGQTVGEWGLPQVEAAYETGNMPALLPAGFQESTSTEIRRIK